MIENQPMDQFDQNAAADRRERRRPWLHIVIGRLALAAGILWLSLIFAFATWCISQPKPRDRKALEKQDARISLALLCLSAPIVPALRMMS